MIRSIIRSGLLAAGLAVMAAPAFAGTYFMIDPNPGGEDYLTGKVYTDVNMFSGALGSNSGPVVQVQTIGNVNATKGYTVITPVDGTDLTTLTFGAADPNLFGEFSFDGQLKATSGGNAFIQVQDNQGHDPETFEFSGLGFNKDFSRIGIITNVPGESIQFIKIQGYFGVVKDINFGPAAVSVVPEPATWSIAIVAFGLLAHRRRKAAMA